MLVRVFKDGRPQQQVFILIEQRSLVERCWERPSPSQVVFTLSFFFISFGFVCCASFLNPPLLHFGQVWIFGHSEGSLCLISFHRRAPFHALNKCILTFRFCQ